MLMGAFWSRPACDLCRGPAMTTVCLDDGVDDLLMPTSRGSEEPHSEVMHHGMQLPPLPANKERAGWVGEYRKLQTLGHGRFGKVRLCERWDGELFALKIFRKPTLARQRHWDPDGETYRSALESVGVEIAIMKKLLHNNVVRLHGVIDDTAKEKLYLVMDYVPGG